MGDVGDPWGRLYQKGFSDSSCWSKENTRVWLVVNALVHASRYWGMFHCCITWRSSNGLVLLKTPSISCARRVS
jgi:hypothetical protein